MNYLFNMIYKPVKWDTNIYFQCAHTMSEQVKQMVLNGELSITNQKQQKELTRQQQIQMIILNQKILLGQQANIIALWVFKTPINEKQWTSYYLNHQYIILKLITGDNEEKYCCLEKNQKRISFMYSDTLQFARNNHSLRPGKIQKRCKTEYWKPEQITSMFLYSDFYQLVRFLFLSQENEKNYDFLNENCHNFCTNVINFLKNHEIK